MPIQNLNQNLNQSLIDFIHKSPTPFHAVQEMQRQLIAAGFEVLDEAASWNLQVGKRYLLTRNASSIIAFIYGNNSLINNGLRMVGAHTDSPCLRVKPNADIYQQGYWLAGVEVYGGALLSPWFDRELSLAGKVSIQDKQGMLHHILIDFKDAIGMVPSLAIHLDREANKQRSINEQKDLPVLLGVVTKDEKPCFKTLILDQVNREHIDLHAIKVLDYELSFYDAQSGSTYGVEKDFIASSRLDNLLSCFVGMQALIAANSSETSLLICSDHEEVGSTSAVGAHGTMLHDCLQRLCGEAEVLARTINQSMMISVDNAHAIHPNFSDKHDNNHGPIINAGPVIKVNVNQRYASNSETQSIFRSLCEVNDIPVQTFVIRSDMACGSTIGPVTASLIGVKTLDIGVPTLAMHSIRETAGSKDTNYLLAALKAFYDLPKC